MVKCDHCERIFDSQESVDNHISLESGELTERAIRGILDAVSKGKQPLGAAKQAGVKPEVWHKALKGNPILQEALQLAQEEAAEKVAEKLFEDATEGNDFRAKEFWLKNRSENWKPESQKLEVSIIETVKALPPMERLERMAELLASRPDLPILDVVDADVVEDGV